MLTLGLLRITRVADGWTRTLPRDDTLERTAGSKPTGMGLRDACPADRRLLPPRTHETTMRRHLDSPRLKPRTSPYSHVVVSGADCFVAGIVAADIPESDAVIGDVEGETDLVMRTIEGILADHGFGMGDLIRVDVHLRDLDEIHIMDRAYERFLDRDALPARTTTQSEKLYGGSRVEITCMARRR